MSITFFQPSTDISPALLISPPIPALFTAISSLPKFFTVSSTSLLLSSGLEESAFTKMASPLLFLISSTNSFPWASLMSLTTTFAPSLANRIAVDYPIPEPVPVIMATLFSNFFI